MSSLSTLSTISSVFSGTPIVNLATSSSIATLITPAVISKPPLEVLTWSQPETSQKERSDIGATGCQRDKVVTVLYSHDSQYKPIPSTTKDVITSRAVPTVALAADSQDLEKRTTKFSTHHKYCGWWRCPVPSDTRRTAPVITHRSEPA